MTLSEQLTDFAAGLRYEDIPTRVREKARWHLLDSVGICIAASTLEPGSHLYEAAIQLGDKKESTAIGFFQRLPSVSAALVNGTLLHGLEYDDTHTRSIIHGSSVVVPSALAVAEAIGATGKELLTALVIGWESLVRFGLAASGSFQRRGFQVTSIFGPLAAALVGGRLLGLNREQIVGAMGIAGSQASGILEYLTEGASVKQMHPGFASHAGLLAAIFAGKGFRGPRTVLEGRCGVYNSYLPEGNYSLLEVTAGLGEIWHTQEISIKPYPCCHYNQAFLDCALTLRNDGLRSEEIDEVICLGPRDIMPIVCDPWAAKLRPKSGYEARFSLPYSVASMLVHGRVDHSTYMDAAVGDRSVLALADRIRFEVDPASKFPTTYPGWVRITKKDKNIIEHKLVAHRGGPENPMTDLEVRQKFLNNATLVMPLTLAEQLADRLLSIETLQSLGCLWEGLPSQRGGTQVCGQF